MTDRASTRIETSVDLGGRTVHAGTARVSERREVTTVFDYASSFQEDPLAFSLGPDLDLSTARHVVGLPAAFQDSAPDRWGRSLIERRIRGEARLVGRTPPTVRETDYLLGVGDAARQGALRFAAEVDGPFLADDAGGIPPLVDLPRLLSAADSAASDGADDLAAVKQLLDAGSATLGGARPKASVIDQGRLLIAKFPHSSDAWDVMAWEKTALDLAEMGGIEVPARRLVDVGGRHVLLIERFDRRAPVEDGPQGRIPYLSAMSLLGATDRRPVDYLEIAEAITLHGSRVSADLRDLFRRIAFTVVINNADDHSRNHGFLRDRGGWRLSPLFDVNPEPDVRRRHATTIGFADYPTAGLDAVRSIAADFRLSSATADEIIDEVVGGTSTWRDVAAVNGVPERQLDEFAPVLDRWR